MIPRDEIIHMAREAGASHMLNDELALFSITAIERFAAMVEARAAAAEREACAKACLKKDYGYDGGGNRYLVFKNYSPEKCAEAIRARGAT